MNNKKRNLVISIHLCLIPDDGGEKMKNFSTFLVLLVIYGLENSEGGKLSSNVCIYLSLLLHILTHDNE